MKKYDVVIVGAGIIGLSIALQIARRSKLRVAVFEKASGVGAGSTGSSSAVCRYRYSRDEMVCLARDGIHAYRNWSQFTGLVTPRAAYQRDGVLWLPGEDLAWARREHLRLQGFGLATELLNDQDISELFPALSTCVIAPDFETGEPHDCMSGGKALFELDGGYVDPVSSAQDLVEACRNKGVRIQFKSQVAEVAVKGDSVGGVTLADGTQIGTSLVVNAAGPWCRSLSKSVGLDLGWNLSPVRIQVLHRDRPQELKGNIPVTVDMKGGIYFRTQNRGQQLIVSSVLEEDEKEEVSDPDSYRSETDEDFEYLKMHALHHRLPKLPYRGKVVGYCGLYTVNFDDVHPILGPTKVDGFWVANGFSGHGFKLAPAVASMIARAITGETDDFDTEVPMSFLSVDRPPIALNSKSVLA